MHQSSQGHLAKDKNSYIVPEMICRVFGNSKNMFMIHSIEVKLASQPRYLNIASFCETPSEMY